MRAIVHAYVVNTQKPAKVSFLHIKKISLFAVMLKCHKADYPTFIIYASITLF